MGKIISRKNIEINSLKYIYYKKNTINKNNVT